MKQVPDEVFFTGVLGAYCGTDPEEGKVYVLPTVKSVSSPIRSLLWACIRAVFKYCKVGKYRKEKGFAPKDRSG